MRIFKSIGMILAAAMVTVGLTGTAAATPPECSSGRAWRGYVAGERQGASIVRRAWLSVDQDPDRLEDFTEAVINALGTTARIVAGTSYADCRIKGFVEGAWEAMWTIQVDTMVECFMDGALWGEMVATVYCSLSYDLGGLALDVWYFHPPTNWCGIHFEGGCTSMANTVAHDECYHYTVGGFATVWAQYRHNECMY